jgi:membrane protease YdiL (CAAX protease family)
MLPDSTIPPSRGAQLAVPLASLVLPGIGQFRRNAVSAGAAFSGAAIAGYALYATGAPEDLSGGEIPLESGPRQSFIGLLLAQGSGEVSAYDAFHSALPALQHEGKYRFATHHASTTALLSAPFDRAFLKRWTTWIQLAYTGVLASVIVNQRKPGVAYERYELGDAAFGTGLAFGAGVGEEALFRGWLLPLLHQNTGGRFWLANGIQATVFGGLHTPQAGGYAALIGGWALWEGWLTRRHDWNIRESIFHHFWYDAIIFAAELLAEERGPGVAITFPTIRF